jgi:small-conductance mechanosensitive channel/CRP-like cAMP-binding protein
MSELGAAARAAMEEPIVVALAVIVLGWCAVRFLFRGHPLGRAVARLVLLVVLTAVLLHGGIVPYQPLTSSGAPFRDAVVAAIKIAWWASAAWLLVGFLRSFLVIERRPHEGKIIQDLLAGVIYLAAGFAVIAYVFDLPVQGLLATSGAIAIILGLALQSTLSDVFSGIVLSVSRPYRPDDWVKLEGGTEGRVIEMNWRATHILTPQRDLAIVPNSTIAKSKIVNVSFPAGIHGITVSVQLDSRTPPAPAIAILHHAVLNCRPILSTPEPGIGVKTINAAYIEFDITFFVDELGVAGTAQSELFDSIFRHLAAAGIALASPPGLPYRARDDRAAPEAATTPDLLLDLVTIFAPLTRDERATLAKKLNRADHERGATLLEPGAMMQSLFIIGSGVVSVTARSEKGDPVELLRLGSGDHFGAVALLTGAVSTGMITALTPVVTYELLKEDLAPILKARPQVAHDLCQALAQRLAAGRSVSSVELAHEMPRRGLGKWLFERLHKLFGLAGHDEPTETGARTEEARAPARGQIEG